MCDISLCVRFILFRLWFVVGYLLDKFRIYIMWGGGGRHVSLKSEEIFLKLIFFIPFFVWFIIVILIRRMIVKRFFFLLWVMGRNNLPPFVYIMVYNAFNLMSIFLRPESWRSTSNHSFFITENDILKKWKWKCDTDEVL